MCDERVGGSDAEHPYDHRGDDGDSGGENGRSACCDLICNGEAEEDEYGADGSHWHSLSGTLFP